MGSLNNLIMTFIIHHPDGTREQYSNHYDEDIESERDAAFDDAYMKFPDCYIESFLINYIFDYENNRLYRN